MSGLQRALFLDRDGVLVRAEIRGGRAYGPITIEDFALLPGILQPLEMLRSAGYLLIVATNQPSISRGELRWSTLERMHRMLKDAVPLDDIVVCPHSDEDDCACRKPKPGLLLNAARIHSIDLGQSFFIGDTGRDLEAGRLAGVETILLDREYNRGEPAAIRVRDVGEGADWILERTR
jgi:D-glycero-D-manno-heptose 1,7-bisphosphate phosphatase